MWCYQANQSQSSVCIAAMCSFILGPWHIMLRLQSITSARRRTRQHCMYSKALCTSLWFIDACYGNQRIYIISDMDYYHVYKIHSLHDPDIIISSDWFSGESSPSIISCPFCRHETHVPDEEVRQYLINKELHLCAGDAATDVSCSKTVFLVNFVYTNNVLNADVHV